MYIWVISVHFALSRRGVAALTCHCKIVRCLVLKQTCPPDDNLRSRIGFVFINNIVSRSQVLLRSLGLVANYIIFEESQAGVCVLDNRVLACTSNS